MAVRLSKIFRISCSSASRLSAYREAFPPHKVVHFSSDTWNNDEGMKDEEPDQQFEDILNVKHESQLQKVDPSKGWAYRGVHKAIVCGKVGRPPAQKMLRNGRTITIFNVGTGGMFDQRVKRSADTPKPAQWHRIVVLSEPLGRYAIRQLVKNSSVYVEGDIECRTYNDSNGTYKTVPEICVRRDGRLRLIKSGESVDSDVFEEFRDLVA